MWFKFDQNVQKIFWRLETYMNGVFSYYDNKQYLVWKPYLRTQGILDFKILVAIRFFFIIIQVYNLNIVKKKWH